MFALTLLACRGYELVAADVDILIAPVAGTEGAFVDITIPMRLQLYGPEFDDGIEWRPYDGFIQTPIDAEVACMGDVVLDASTRSDQLAVFFTRGVNDFDGMVAGADFTEGGWSSRRRGEAVGVLEFDFPCLPARIPHEVSFVWTVDRSAPVPYDDVP